MRILIAEDEAASRHVLCQVLTSSGYEVEVCETGLQALEVLQREDAPHICILDWVLPGMDGIDIIRQMHAKRGNRAFYAILLTAKREKSHLLEGLDAGADDYIAKPFNKEELQARVGAGVRIISLQQTLTDRVHQLEKLLAQVRQLQGLLPICAYCKKIRDDNNYWQQVETYFSQHSGAQFSHCVCPECYQKVITPELDKLRASRPAFPA